MRARVEDAGSCDGDARWGAGVDRWIDGVVENRAANCRAAFSMDRRGSRRSGWNRFVEIRWTGNPNTWCIFKRRDARGKYVASFVAHFVSDSTARLETAAPSSCGRGGERSRSNFRTRPPCDGVDGDEWTLRRARRAQDAFSRDDARGAVCFSRRGAAVLDEARASANAC